jgi:hypothetical protein
MRRIDERHAAGWLSDACHRELREIVEQAQAGNWGEAERLAYEFWEKNPSFP